MALNCTMLDPNTNKPIPLPQEKIFFSVPAVTISLTPTPPGSCTTTTGEPMSPGGDIAVTQTSNSKGKIPLRGLFESLSLGSSPDRTVSGTIYITTQRLIFVTDTLSSSTDDEDDREIKTLTVPLTHSLDGRYIQPWLSANYHISTVMPVPGGNLERLVGGADGGPDLTFTLKVVFNEGHGYEFYEALEEVKRLVFDNSGCQHQAELEDLPSYSPPTSQPTALVEANTGTSSSTSGFRSGTPQRRDSIMPADDLLEAAQTAIEEEEHENQQRLAQTAAPSTDIVDDPPSYQP